MDLRATAIITGVDRFSPVLARIQGAASAMMGGMAGAGAALGRAGAEAARGMALLGAPVAMIGRSGFDAAFGLEKMMNKVQAVGRLTDEQRAGIQAYAQDLNALYPFTNQEIAGAAFELFRAGFNYEQARGALKSTLDMALAGDISRQEAADIATNVLTAMRLPMETTEQAAASAKRASDVLAYAATNSNTDIRMLGETFKYVAPLAASAGLSIESVAAMAMTMANNGIKSSEAGVAMRSMLVRMAKPTKDMMATLERLNININDFITGGREIGADDIISSLFASGVDASGQRKRIESMLKDDVLRLKPAQLAANLTDIIAKEAEGAADRNVIAEAITDVLTAGGKQYDALGFLEALRKKGVGLSEISRIMDIRQGGRVLTLLLDDLKAKTAQIEAEATGAAGRMSDLMQQGTVGALAAMKAAWENFWVSVGKAGAMDDIANAFRGVTAFLKDLGTYNPELLRMGAHAGMALAAMSALGFVLMGLGPLLANPLALTIAVTGLASVTWLVSNYEKLERLWSEPHKIAIEFPNAPDWLIWLIENGHWLFKTLGEGASDSASAAQQRYDDALAGSQGTGWGGFGPWLWNMLPDAPWSGGSDTARRGGVATFSAPPGFGGDDIYNRRVPIAAPAGFGDSYGTGGQPFLPERNSSRMVRDIAPTAGPQTVDVTGKVEADVAVSGEVSGTVTGEIRVVPPPGWQANWSQAPSGEVRAPLRTGKSMPDTGAGGGG